MQADGTSDTRRISSELIVCDPAETFAKIRDYFRSECIAMLSQRQGKRRLLDNPADIGQAVEDIYLGFLEQQVPATCDLLKGGYVFDVEGYRSRQMDIFVHSGNTHRFRDSSRQACASLEGTVAAIEVTSFLDKRKIDAELTKFAFIPPTRPFKGIGNRKIFETNQGFSDFWFDTPLKVVVAFDGADADKALDQINSFYTINSHIPIARRMNILHMLNRYCIIKSDFDVYPDNDKRPGVYTAVGSGHVDGLATSLILTRISQLLHLILRNAYQANDLWRNMFRAARK